MADRLKRRRWADVVVIVAGVYAFLSAAWQPFEFLGRDAGEVGHSGWMWGSYATAGTLAIAGLLIGQKWPTVGKLMCGLGGIAMLSAFTALSNITAFAAISIGLTGVALLIAAPFMGPMPSPEEEGHPRSMHHV